MTRVELLIEVDAVSPLTGRLQVSRGGLPQEVGEQSFSSWLELLRALSDVLETPAGPTESLGAKGD